MMVLGFIFLSLGLISFIVFQRTSGETIGFVLAVWGMIIYAFCILYQQAIDKAYDKEHMLELKSLYEGKACSECGSTILKLKKKVKI